MENFSKNSATTLVFLIWEIFLVQERQSKQRCIASRDQYEIAGHKSDRVRHDLQAVLKSLANRVSTSPATPLSLTLSLSLTANSQDDSGWR